MKLSILAAAAFLLASPRPAPLAEPVADEETPFSATTRTFPDERSCIAHLTAIVSASAPPAFDAAVGPYTIAPGDIRAHRVRAEAWGHAIEEFRCAAAALSSRRWSHSMSDVKPFTIEDIGTMSFPEK